MLYTPLQVTQHNQVICQQHGDSALISYTPFLSPFFLSFLVYKLTDPPWGQRSQILPNCDAG